jgi:hypothetical protein
LQKIAVICTADSNINIIGVIAAIDAKQVMGLPIARSLLELGTQSDAALLTELVQGQNGYDAAEAAQSDPGC